MEQLRTDLSARATYLERLELDHTQTLMKLNQAEEEAQRLALSIKHLDGTTRAQIEQQNTQRNQLLHQNSSKLLQITAELAARNQQLECLSAEHKSAKVELDYRN